MAQVSKYRYLLNQYPETVQKEQFRIICHISKRTARYLLQSGLVPCVQSGKKTRNYTIKMKDIVRYLERREIHPEKYKLPPGSYICRWLLTESSNRNSTSRCCPTRALIRVAANTRTPLAV